MADMSGYVNPERAFGAPFASSGTTSSVLQRSAGHEFGNRGPGRANRSGPIDCRNPARCMRPSRIRGSTAYLGYRLP